MKYLAIVIFSLLLPITAAAVRSDGGCFDCTPSNYVSGSGAAAGSIYFNDDTGPVLGNGLDCWLYHLSALNSTCLVCTDVDGGGTDGNVWCVDNGTDDLDLGGSLTLPAAQSITYLTRLVMTATADGYLLLTDIAGTDFDRIMLGGVTSSYPAIKRSGTSVYFVRANDGTFTDVNVGNITTATDVLSGRNIQVGSAGKVYWSGTNSRILNQGDGIMTVSNQAENDFARLQLGGTTSSYPSLKRSTTGVVIRLADDSANAPLTASTLTVDSYTRHIDLQIGAAVLGPTAPDLKTVGVARGYGFDADGDAVFFALEVPSDWDGATDMTIHIWWSNESGTAIADTEDVKWDAHYRATAASEDLDGGGTAANTITTTYTQSGAGVDAELHDTTITVDYDDATWPLTVGDLISIQLDRDVSGESNSYGADAVIFRVDLIYNSTTLPNH